MSEAGEANAGFGTREMRMLVTRGSLATLLILSAGASVLFLYGLVSGQDALTYAALASFAFVVPLSVALLRPNGIDVFEPIFLVALALLVGTTLRAFYLMGDADRAAFLMMGTSFDAVNDNMAWILGGLLSFSLCYALVPGRWSIERFEGLRSFVTSPGRLYAVAWLTGIVGLVGIVLFIQHFNIALTGNILEQSIKRAQAYTVDGQEYYGVGYEVFLGKFAQYGLLMIAGAMLAGMLRLTFTAILTVAILGFLSLVVPFLTSSRLSIIVLAINVIAIAYYYQRLPVRFVVAAGIGFVLLISAMGQLRVTNQSEGETDRVTIVDKTIGSGNSLDFVRTSAIMDRVPEVHGYLYGSSYLALLTAPIPRSVWPSKPEPALGSFVKSNLFGEQSKRNGWPTGVIAEAHVNFGKLGIIVMMGLLGAFLRFFYESFRPFLGVSLPMTILYASAAWRISFDLVGVTIAQGFLQALQFLVPLGLFLAFCRIGAPVVRRRSGGAIEPQHRFGAGNGA